MTRANFFWEERGEGGSLCPGLGWEVLIGWGNKNLVWGFYWGVELFQVRECANFRLIVGEILANYSFNVI